MPPTAANTAGTWQESPASPDPRPARRRSSSCPAEHAETAAASEEVPARPACHADPEDPADMSHLGRTEAVPAPGDVLSRTDP
jgi:hypothetical protein